MPIRTDQCMTLEINFHGWSGRRFEPKTTQRVLEEDSAKIGAGRWTQSIVPPAMLNPISAQEERVRKWLKRIPPHLGSLRIFQNKDYMDILATVNGFKSERQGLVKQMIKQYTNFVAFEAKQFLGDKYDRNLYPEPSRLESMFTMDVTIGPVPNNNNDWRISDVDDETEAQIRADYAESQERREQEIRQEIADVIYDKVNHIYQTLLDKDAVFRAPTIEDFKEQAAIIRSMNFLQDQRIEQIAKQVEKLSNADVKGLRKDKHYRQQFANDAKSILNKLGSIQYADSTAQYGADQESSGSSSSGSSGNGTQQTNISPGGPVLRQPDIHAEDPAGRNYQDDGDQWNASVLQR